MANDIDIKYKNALVNAYKAITHKAMPDEATLEQQLVPNNRDDAEALVLEMKGIVPNIDQEITNFNYFALTPGQREALKAVIERSALYRTMKKFKDPASNKLLQYNVESTINPLEAAKKYCPLTIQLNDAVGDIIPSYANTGFYGFWDRNIKLLAPTANWQWFTGTEPLNHGWDSSRMKATGVSGYQIDNLGVNWMATFSDSGSWNWYNFIGIDYRYKDLYNRTEKDSPAYIGYDNYVAYKWNMVLPTALSLGGLGYALNEGMAAMGLSKPGVSQNIMTTTLVDAEYFERSDRRDYLYQGTGVNRHLVRGIPTEMDPDVRSFGYMFDVTETLGGPLSAGIKYLQEYGLRTPLQDASFAFRDERWTLHGAYEGLNDSLRYTIRGQNTWGKYEQDTVAGRFDQAFPDPLRPSAPYIYRPDPNDAPAAVSPGRSRVKNWDRSLNVELEFLKLSVLNKWPLTVRAGVSNSQYMWQEAARDYTFGVGLGKLISLDYTHIVNNIAEVNPTGDQVTHRLDAGLYIDLADIAGTFFMGGWNSPISGGIKLNGYWMKDNGASDSVKGGSVSFQFGFSTGLNNRTKDLNEVVVKPRNYVVGAESPNNREIMEDQLERELVRARDNGALLPNGKLYYPLNDEEVSAVTARRKTTAQRAEDSFKAVLKMGLEDAQGSARTELSKTLVALRNSAAAITLPSSKDPILAKITALETKYTNKINDAASSTDCGNAIKELTIENEALSKEIAGAIVSEQRNDALTTLKGVHDFNLRNSIVSHISGTAKQAEYKTKVEAAYTTAKASVGTATKKPEMEDVITSFSCLISVYFVLPEIQAAAGLLTSFESGITVAADKTRFKNSKYKARVLKETADFSVRLLGGKLSDGTTVAAPKTKDEAMKIYDDFVEYKKKNLKNNTVIRAVWTAEG